MFIKNQEKKRKTIKIRKIKKGAYQNETWQQKFY